MFDQVVLLDRLAHLKAKQGNKAKAISATTELNSLTKIRRTVLGDVIVAIQKIEKHPDTYGICEECECLIPLKRLQSLPEARLCLGCQQEIEFKRQVM